MELAAVDGPYETYAGGGVVDGWMGGWGGGVEGGGVDGVEMRPEQLVDADGDADAFEG